MCVKNVVLQNVFSCKVKKIVVQSVKEGRLKCLRTYVGFFELILSQSLNEVCLSF